MISLDWINAEWTIALMMAIIHSFWQGILIAGLLFAVEKSKLLSHPRYVFIINMAGLYVLFGAFITTFYSYLDISETVIGPDYSSGIASTLSELTVFSAEAQQAITIELIIAIIWMVGATFFALRFAIGGHQILQIKKHASMAPLPWQKQMEELSQKIGVKTQVLLKQSAVVAVPMVIGVFKPIVILPAAYFNHMTPKEMESILIHELVHIKRSDFAFKLIQHGIECFLFFNPATWWLVNQINRNREYVCDDEVQQNLDLKKPYLNALYKVAHHSGRGYLISNRLFKNKSELIMRVKRMLNNSKNDLFYRPVFSVFALILMGLIFFSFTKEQKEENPKPDQTEMDITSTQVTPKQVISEIEPRPTKAEEIVLQQVEQEVVTSTPEPQYYLVNLEDTLDPDTLPSNPRIRELEALLEQKAEELEELSDQLSDEMEEKIEAEVERLEELAERLEDILEPRMEALEDELSEEEMEKMEELGERLEEIYEDRLEDWEETMEEDVMEELEEKLEELAEELEEELEEQIEEGESEVTSETIQKLNKEMQAVQQQIQSEMAEFHQQYQKLNADPEVLQIQKEMQQISLQIQQSAQGADVWTDEALQLQEEMTVVQQEIENQVSQMSNELIEKINQKTAEIEKISKELQEERRKAKN